MQELLVCAASLGIGLSLGLMGAGGSILTIPVFVYILKKDPLSSSVYSMFVVGISGLAGSIQSIVNRLVNFHTAIMFGLPSIAGVWFARKWILPSIPDQVFSIGSFNLSKEILFMLCLAALMCIAAIKMMHPVAAMNDKENNKYQSKETLLLSRGLLTGIITGLLGIGGGFLIVPALYFWAGLPVKKAIGTALLIITANSLFGFVSSYSSLLVDWMLLLKFSTGAIIGILIGTRLSAILPARRLKKIFAYFILTVSVYIMYKQFFL